MQTARLNLGIRIGIFLFLWLGLHAAFSQGIQQPIPKEVATNSNGSLHVRYGYQEYLPVGYDPQSDEKWPLIIHMVGVGERGNGSIHDLDTIAGIGISKLLKTGKDYPFLIMSPQPTGDQTIPLNNDTNTGKFVADTLGVFIDYILENYNVDLDRVYITAFSAAAEQAATYIAKNPTKIAAFIPISGNARYVKNFCNIADIPVWAFHNIDDPNIPSSGSIGLISDLKNCNPPPIVRPKVTIYPGNRHDAWSKTYNGSGMGQEIIQKNYDPFDITIFDWFLKYTKSQSVVADAGPTQYITQPEDSAALTGSSRPGTGVTYAWKQIGTTPATATLSGQNTAILTATNLTAKGEYQFELTVTDAQNNVSRDTASIIVKSFVVDAGSNKTITLPTNSTTLNGKVEDAVPGETFTYRWTQVNGPNDGIFNGVPVNEKQATFSDPNVAETTVSDLVVGTYKFEFEVTDNTGEIARDYVEVTVRNTNDSLVANAGNDTTVILPVEQVILKGSASDAELNTIISYQWTQISGNPTLTLTNADTPELEITDLQPGIFAFEFKVNNDNGGTAADTVVLTVEDPNALAAKAGNDTTIVLPIEQLEITGSGTPIDRITGYQWVKVSGPEATLTGTDQATLIVENLMKGTYQFELTVTDGQAQAKDTIAVFVETTNDSLAANAGGDISVNSSQESVEITGSGTDPYNEITGYQWTKLNGPEATLTGQDQAMLTVSGLQEGTYEFELTVTNDNEGIAKDTMVLTVTPCEPPAIDPIEDITASQDQMPVEVPLNISGVELSSATISAVSDNQAIIADDNIKVTIENGAAKLVITANADTSGSANITVTVGESCASSEQFAITVNEAVTGVKDELEDLAIVYPNPSLGVFLLQWKEVVPKGAEISIFTIEGALLKRFNVQENQREFTIDLHTSVKGTYLLRLKVDNKIRTYRIIKE